MKVPILLPNIFDYPFTYENKIINYLKPGDFVKVSFGSKEQTGVVWDFEQESKKKIRLKQVIKKFDLPRMNQSMMKFITWFSKYNIVSLGMSLRMSLLNKNVVENWFFFAFFRLQFNKILQMRRVFNQNRFIFLSIGKSI